MDALKHPVLVAIQPQQQQNTLNGPDPQHSPAPQPDESDLAQSSNRPTYNATNRNCRVEQLPLADIAQDSKAAAKLQVVGLPMPQ